MASPSWYAWILCRFLDGRAIDAPQCAVFDPIGSPAKLFARIAARSKLLLFSFPTGIQYAPFHSHFVFATGLPFDPTDMGSRKKRFQIDSFKAAPHRSTPLAR